MKSLLIAAAALATLIVTSVHPRPMHAPATAAAAIAAAAATRRGRRARLSRRLPRRSHRSRLSRRRRLRLRPPLRRLWRLRPRLSRYGYGLAAAGARPASAPPDTTAAAAGPLPITDSTTAPAATTDRDIAPGVSGDGVGSGPRPSAEPAALGRAAARGAPLPPAAAGRARRTTFRADAPGRRELAAMPIDVVRQIARPRPIPLGFEVTNGSKILSALAVIDAVAESPISTTAVPP